MISESLRLQDLTVHQILLRKSMPCRTLFAKSIDQLITIKNVKLVPGLKKMTAFRHAYSVSSNSKSTIGWTSSSIVLIAILRISISGWFLLITSSLPNNKASLIAIERRVTPSIRCSLACARSNDTWSSKGNSQNTGIYFAHSTRTRSCCFIDSTISLLVASLLRFRCSVK